MSSPTLMKPANVRYIRDIKYALWRITDSGIDGQARFVGESASYKGDKPYLEAPSETVLLDKIDVYIAKHERELSGDDRVPLAAVSALGGVAVAALIPQIRAPWKIVAAGAVAAFLGYRAVDLKKSHYAIES